MIWVLAAAGAFATVPVSLRWLRVAQREHYLAPSTTRFALRWWNTGWANRVLLVIEMVGLGGAFFDVRMGFLAVLAQVGPIGLSLKGRTSKLAWTLRLRRVAAVSGTIVAVLFVVGAVTELAWLIALGLIVFPSIIDLSLLALAPIEQRMGNRWVEKAASKLKSSGAQVVAITGSYGKTTAKVYLNHLISGSVRTVASPASFNNRMGLARAVNEQLVPGTEVFIAEMGTYGKGEIASLCQWIEPSIAAIVAIGPVHLERFRTEERIVEAKAEILDRAGSAVIAVDHPLLATLVEQRSGALPITTVATTVDAADVVYRQADRMLLLAGEPLGPVPVTVFPVNLAVAVGIAHRLGIDPDPGLFNSLPSAEHRQTISVSERGVTIIDDTFNSNPAGARAGLDLLSAHARRGRKVLVTPGMVELGPRQDLENEELARTAAGMCDDIVVIGATNRLALLRGSAEGPASVTVVANREEAVNWVRSNLQAGDAVLYENDLPDHYP